MFIQRREFNKETPPGSQLRKGFSLVRRDTDTSVLDRPIIFAISTESVDRMGDTIAVGGWDTEDYQKNPVVLWAHNSWDLPVAKSERLWVENGMLLSAATFAKQDEHPFGYTVGQMVRAGFLNAVSVGFDPVEYKFNEERPGKWGMPGIDFLKQTLLEYSVVPIPANAEALVQAKGLGIDTSPYLEWIDKTVALVKGPGFWVSKETLEGLWKNVRPEVTRSLPPVRKDEAATAAMLGEMKATLSAVAEDVTAIRDCVEEMSDDIEVMAGEEAVEEPMETPPKAEPPAVSKSDFESMLAGVRGEFTASIKTALTGKLD